MGDLADGSVLHGVEQRLEDIGVGDGSGLQAFERRFGLGGVLALERLGPGGLARFDFMGMWTSSPRGLAPSLLVR